jgi:hypothetical protein
MTREEAQDLLDQDFLIPLEMMNFLQDRRR